MDIGENELIETDKYIIYKKTIKIYMTLYNFYFILYNFIIYNKINTITNIG